MKLPKQNIYKVFQIVSKLQSSLKPMLAHHEDANQRQEVLMSKPVILLIEDNREVRLSARFILEDHGFSLTELENLPRPSTIYSSSPRI